MLQPEVSTSITSVIPSKERIKEDIQRVILKQITPAHQLTAKVIEDMQRKLSTRINSSNQVSSNAVRGKLTITVTQANHILLKPKEYIQRNLTTQETPNNLPSVAIKHPQRKLTVIKPIKISSKAEEDIKNKVTIKVEPTNQSELVKVIKKELEGAIAKNEELQQCRVCLNEGDIPIFGNQHFEDMSENLCCVADIEIDQDDEYPKHLCSECHWQLQNAVQFRKTAKQSDMVLRQPKSEKDTFDHINSDAFNNNSLSELKETNCKDGIFTTASEPKQLEEDRQDNTDEDDDIYTDNALSNLKPKGSGLKPKDINDGALTAVTKVKRRKTCKSCYLKFDTIESYKEHMLTHKIVCPKCDKRFTERQYSRHEKICVGGSSTLVCDICGTIRKKSTFRHHRMTHFLEFPFQCDLCPFKGRFKDCLRSHMKKHTDERRYQCEKCPKSFTTASNLIRHSNTHKDTFDYMCDCGRGFHDKRSYELHKKIVHTGVKEHICNICQKAFSYRKQMMKHTRKVHKREPLSFGRMPAYLLAEMQQKNQEQAVPK